MGKLYEQLQAFRVKSPTLGSSEMIALVREIVAAYDGLQSVALSPEMRERGKQLSTLSGLHGIKRNLEVGNIEALRQSVLLYGLFGPGRI